LRLGPRRTLIAQLAVRFPLDFITTQNRNYSLAFTCPDPTNFKRLLHSPDAFTDHSVNKGDEIGADLVDIADLNDAQSLLQWLDTETFPSP
jgi:hypothetical protein